MEKLRPSTYLLGKEKDPTNLAIACDALALIVVVIILIWAMGYISIAQTDTSPFYTTTSSPSPTLVVAEKTAPVAE